MAKLRAWHIDDWRRAKEAAKLVAIATAAAAAKAAPPTEFAAVAAKKWGWMVAAGVGLVLAAAGLGTFLGRKKRLVEKSTHPPVY